MNSSGEGGVDVWYRFEIPFRTVIKKNNRTIYTNKKTGKPFIGKSRSLAEYEQETILTLQSQLNRLNLPKPLFTAPLMVKYYFQYASTCRADWDNLVGAVQDCAQKAGILLNDKLIKHAEVHILEHTGEDKTIMLCHSLCTLPKDYLDYTQIKSFP